LVIEYRWAGNQADRLPAFESLAKGNDASRRYSGHGIGVC
jgi:hypothetical protein